MAGRTRIPAAVSALVAGAAIAPMRLASALLLRAAAARTLLGAVRLGRSASFLLRTLLLRPGLTLGIGPLMPSLIAVAGATAAAAMPLLARGALGLGRSVILLAILRLALRRRGIGAVARRTRTVLVRPGATLAVFASAMRPAMMRPSAGSAFGPLELGLRPAETPDFLEFGIGAFAWRGFGLSGCLSICMRGCRSGGIRGPGGCAFATGSVRLRRCGFGVSLARSRRNIVVRFDGSGAGSSTGSTTLPSASAAPEASSPAGSAALSFAA